MSEAGNRYSIRAKFKVQTVTHHEGGDIQVVMGAVTDDGIPEHARFHKYTPSGELRMYVTNPAVAEYLKPGRLFYLDFTVADPPRP